MGNLLAVLFFFVQKLYGFGGGGGCCRSSHLKKKVRAMKHTNIRKRINDQSIAGLFSGDNVCLTCHFNEMQHHLINKTGNE